MALFKRFFYRKPPDHLLEISERVYVFDSCFSADRLEGDQYSVYMDAILSQLHERIPDSSFIVFNFQEGDKRTELCNLFTRYNITVMDYPQDYKKCPLLPLEMINQFLQSCVNLFSSETQQNVLLMHCERGGWPVLAFMLAGLLLSRKQFNGEQKTLEMLYKQASKEVLRFLSPINPQPSQLRYLHYISRKTLSDNWPPPGTLVEIDTIIIRFLPVFEKGKECRPIVRVYGKASSVTASGNSNLLISTAKKKMHPRHYVQEDCDFIKLDIQCSVEGDVVLECVLLYEDQVNEEIIFRAAFHTSFLRSNPLVLRRDEVDKLWNSKDKFPKNFEVEVLFLDVDSLVHVQTSDTIKVKDIVVDLWGSKTDHPNAIVDMNTNKNGTEVLTECEESEVPTETLKLNLRDTAQKLDLKVQEQKVSSDVGGWRADKILSPALKKAPTFFTKAVVDTIKGKEKAKQQEPSPSLTKSANKGKPTVSKWIPTNKGSYTNSMHVAYPPTRTISVPPSGATVAAPKKKNFLRKGDGAKKSASHTNPTSIRVSHGLLDSPKARFVRMPPSPLPPDEPSVMSSKTLHSGPPPLVSPSSACKVGVPALTSRAAAPSTGDIQDFCSPRPPLPTPDSPFLITSLPSSYKPAPPPPPPFNHGTATKMLRSSLPLPSSPVLTLPPSPLILDEENDGFQISNPPKPPPTPPWKSGYSYTSYIKSSNGPATPPAAPSILPAMNGMVPESTSFGVCKPILASPIRGSITDCSPTLAENSSIKEECALLPSFKCGPPPPPPRPQPSPSMHRHELPLSQSVQRIPSLIHSASGRAQLQAWSPPPLPYVIGASPPPLTGVAPMHRHQETSLTGEALSPTLTPSIVAPPPPPVMGVSHPLHLPIYRVPPPPPLPITTVPPPLPPLTYRLQPPSSLPLSAMLPSTPRPICAVPLPPPPPMKTVPSLPPPPISGLPRPTPHSMSPVLHPSSLLMNGVPPPPVLPTNRVPLLTPPPMSEAQPLPHPPMNAGFQPPPPPISKGIPPRPPPLLGATSPPPLVTGIPGPPIAPHPPGGLVPPPPLGAKGPGSGGLSLRRDGGLSCATANKKSLLKPLHWSKVSRAIKGSLWDELQRNGETHIAHEFDVSDIERFFSAVVPKQDKRGDGRKSTGSKTDKITLVDLRRANNTEIMLSKVKMPLPNIVAAVLALDESVLDIDQVENLIKFCPTKEEMDLLQSYTGDKEKLGKCEQYFLELMKVPRVESKLRVFAFKIQFGTQIKDFEKSLTIVNTASEEVRKSLKLKEIMKRILFLGNTLNNGTARGSAVGFKLDTLLKLYDTRSSNSKMTLMHYLCKVLASKSPNLIDFHNDLGSLEAASKIQLKSLAEEMQAIIKGLEKVKAELAASENDGLVSDLFRKTLKEFVGSAGTEVASVTEFYSAVDGNANALALYFGEDPARYPFEQVCATIVNFVKLFQKAHEENLRETEQEKRKLEKEAETDKAKETNLSKSDKK